MLIFWHIQLLHLIDSEVAWEHVSSETEVKSKIILEPDYLPDYLSVSYDFAIMDSVRYLGRLQDSWQKSYRI